MTDLTGVINRHPVIAFYILAFVISWLGWIPQMLYEREASPVNLTSQDLLGCGGHTIAAVIVTLFLKEKDGLRKLFRPLFDWWASAWSVIFVFGF